MHFESGVGHIGGNLSALDAMMLLQHEYLHTDKEPFILWKGHAAGGELISRAVRTVCRRVLLLVVAEENH